MSPPGGAGRFGAFDHPARLERLRVALDDAGPDGTPVDALVLTKAAHQQYLVGFTGSSGWLLVDRERALLVTDGRYRDQAEAQLSAAAVTCELEISTEVDKVLGPAVAGGARVGLEAASVSWAAQRRYASDWFGHAELVPTEGVLEALRAVKDEAEIARIAAAADAADAGLEAVLARLVDGPTEAEFAFELELAMRRAGADGVAFETIIASGPNAARPHVRPSSRRIGPGELVVIDFGAAIDSYRSDMTRTVCVGEPGPRERELYDVVIAAQAAGVAAVRPGVEAVAIDAAAREPIEARGWGDHFDHGTGHGLGLEIHEAPYVGRSSTATIVESSVITVEPGVYFSGFGGVRIEDTVLVTASGCRALTRFPKQLAPLT